MTPRSLFSSIRSSNWRQMAQLSKVSTKEFPTCPLVNVGSTMGHLSRDTLNPFNPANPFNPLTSGQELRFPNLGQEYRTLKITLLCRFRDSTWSKTGAETTSERKAVNGRRAWHRELGRTGFARCLGPPYPRQPRQRRLLRPIPILSIARPHPMRQ